MQQHYLHTTQEGNSLQLTLFSEQPFGKLPCIIICHGFKGFKDWGFFPYAAEELAKAGFSVITFNFSHNGIGANPTELTEEDKFERNTFSLEVSEAMQVLDLCVNSTFFGDFCRKKIGMIGHSRGGGSALMAAAKHKAVTAVVTWASISTFDRWPKKKREAWRKQGYQEVINSRTGQILKMGMDMLNDIEANASDELNLLDHLKTMHKPLLILHGNLDEAVAPYEAEQLNVYGDAMLTRMRMIPNAGHTFGIVHPFAGTSPEFELVLGSTRDFFEEWL